MFLVYKSKVVVFIKSWVTLIFLSVILSVIFISKIGRSYEFSNLGFTPQRLAERHGLEEGLVGFYEDRLRFLKAERKVIAHSLGENNATRIQRSILHWRWALLTKTLNFTFSYNLGEELRKIMVEELQYAALSTSAEDAIGSHEMLLNFKAWYHLQQLMLFHPHKLSQGLTLDTLKGGRLTLAQELDISMFLLNDRRYYMAFEWIEHALIQSRHHQFMESHKISPHLLSQFYRICAQKHNKWRNKSYSKIPTPKDFHMDVIDFFSKPVTNTSLPRTVSEQIYRPTNREKYYNKYKGYRTDRNKITRHAQFIDGCIGNIYMPVEEKNKLYCYLDNKRNPYFYINPLYVDILSHKRELYQYHKVIGESTIKRLLNIRKKELQENNLKCGLTDYNFPFCEPGSETPIHVFKLTEFITGFKHTMCSGQCHCIEYTPGRTAWEHNDHTGDRRPEELYSEQLREHGDYLATFLYYLEGPELGGHTVFMPAGNYAPPVKGSAVFWWGMYRNGKLRFNETDHGACPVVHGGKIVLTHFIRYNTNWQTHKCSLDPLE